MYSDYYGYFNHHPAQYPYRPVPHIHPNTAKAYEFKSVEMNVTQMGIVRGFIYKVDVANETVFYATCEFGTPVGNNALDVKQIIQI
ncbi:hypothetical protein, partial [Bacillus safensis]|uniref:hypothetical protein n=1 Tax=Bacillus safensis TaxID=561879 RepID=UPI003000EBAF